MSSTLTDKNILIVGEESSQIKNLEVALRAYGIKIHAFACDSVTPMKVTDLKIDLIIYNNLLGGQTCLDALAKLKNDNLCKTVPIFMLVEESTDKIQDVLSSGASDYITPNESTDTTIQKIKSIFGHAADFSSSSNIDITPTVASVTATGIKVYVVEDDALLRNLLSMQLDKSSFPFEFSPDGKDVVPAIKKFKPDIIILDLMLPGKSGFEVLEEVKADENLKNIPVLVFSNKDEQFDRKRAKELGADGYYVKAMTDLSQLVEMIESSVK